MRLAVNNVHPTPLFDPFPLLGKLSIYIQSRFDSHLGHASGTRINVQEEIRTNSIAQSRFSSVANAHISFIKSLAA